MATTKRPTRRSAIRAHNARRDNAIKSSDPPQRIKRGPDRQGHYSQPASAQSIGRLLMNLGWNLYNLARHPWIFVLLIGIYLIFSIIWLVQKFSTFNVVSVIASVFVLVFAITHNFVQVVDCLGAIFRQVGFAFKLTGRAFGTVGRAFRRAAVRLRQTVNDARTP